MALKGIQKGRATAAERTMSNAADMTADDGIRAWAAEVLGVASVAPRPAITAALLARVRDEDFVPGPEVAVAFEVLVGCASVDGEAKRVWQVGIESRLRADVERFAQSFFDVPPADRQAAWQLLRQRAENWPALRRRLMRWEPGLTVPAVEPALLEQPHVAALTSLIASCFVATPPESARLRCAQGREIHEHHAGWLQAAHTLHALRPDFVRLAPDLIDWVVRGAVHFADSNLQFAQIKVAAQQEKQRAAVVRDTESSATRRVPLENRLVLLGLLIGIVWLVSVHSRPDFSLDSRVGSPRLLPQRGDHRQMGRALQRLFYGREFPESLESLAFPKSIQSDDAADDSDPVSALEPANVNEFLLESLQ
jgi:hypothetical protein